MSNEFRRSTLDFLIVSTGRAGSKYFARLLATSGMTCGHEAVFNSPRESVVRKNYLSTNNIAESSWMSAPFLSAPWFSSEIKIIHLLRNPLHVARSFHDINFFSAATVGRKYNRIVYENSRISPASQDRLGSSVAHYFFWNDLIRSQLAKVDNQSITVRLEDVVLDDCQARVSLQDFLGFELSEFNRVVNSKAKEKRRHTDVPFDEERAKFLILEFQQDYGDFGYP